MARVKGPLFSVAASGKFKGMEFRTGGGTTTVATQRTPPRERTPAQIAQATRFQVAVTAWKALDDTTHQQWKQAAQGTGNSGYQLYIAEYIGQAITPPGQPAIP